MSPARGGFGSRREETRAEARRSDRGRLGDTRGGGGFWGRQRLETRAEAKAEQGSSVAPGIWRAKS